MTNSLSGSYTITGSSSTDNLVGGAGDDIFIISSTGDGDTDTLDGGLGDDTLKLAAVQTFFQITQN